MGRVSERIYLCFDDLIVKFAHVTEKPNLIKISLDQAFKAKHSKAQEITIHDQRIHLKDLYEEQVKAGVLFNGDIPQRYSNIVENIGWKNCCAPIRFHTTETSYKVADHSPKGQNPSLLRIPADAGHGAEIELWFYPIESEVTPPKIWSSIVTIETMLGTIVFIARARPGLVPGITERPSKRA